MQPGGEGEISEKAQSARAAPVRRVGFLYNHDAAHQVRHSAAAIAPLIERHPQIEVTVFASSDEQLNTVRAVIGAAATRCRLRRLDLPAWHKPFARVLDKAMPFSRLDRLATHRSIFRGLDALVVTEGTSLFLKRYPELAHLKMIRIDHGAGDRAIGYQPSFARNDLVVIAGRKQRDRLIAVGVPASRIAVAGYPKFDAIDAAAGRTHRFFDNNKPTVLYNPHPDPALSSWYALGLDVLEYFYRSGAYNLIFAPHVMLFLRRVFVSMETFAVGWRRALPEKYRACPHMRVDTGSPASLDMTYTLGADIYLGDVSSQVYEFLIAPRPCIFLDTQDRPRQDDPNYAFRRFGPVVHDIAGLDAALKIARADHPRYRSAQEAGFAETFDLTDVPSCARAAAAIAAVVEGPSAQLNPG